MCRLTLSEPAPSGGSKINLSTTGQLTAPNSVSIDAGSSTVSFSVQGRMVQKQTQAELNAKWNLGNGPPDALNVGLTLVPVLASSLSCQQNQITGGGQASCTVNLNTSAFSADVQLNVSTSSADAIVPSSIRIRPQHDQASFAVIANSVAGQESAKISVTGADGPIEQEISILPDNNPQLSVGPAYTVKAGTNLHFVVSASDPLGTAVSLSILNPPQGARFAAAGKTATFDWTPTTGQAGLYFLQFRAVAQPHGLKDQTVMVEVDGTVPVLTSAVDAASFSSVAACSPGGLATLFGAGLKEGDPKLAGEVPLPREIDGAAVLVNGSEMPILYASSSQINFQCPYSPPGTHLDIQVKTGRGTSIALGTSMAAVTPAVFVLSPLGPAQAAALLGGSSLIVMPRNGLVPSEPAEVGDVISLYVSGLGEVDRPVSIGDPAPLDHLVRALSDVHVSFGGIQGEVTFAGYAPGYVGLYQVNVKIPAGLATGDAVPLWIEVPQSGGTIVKSAPVSIAIEN